MRLAYGGALALFVCLVTVLYFWQPPVRSEMSAGAVKMQASREETVQEKLDRQRAYNDYLAPRVMRRIIEASEKAATQ